MRVRFTKSGEGCRLPVIHKGALLLDCTTNLDGLGGSAMQCFTEGVDEVRLGSPLQSTEVTSM